MDNTYLNFFIRKQFGLDKWVNRVQASLEYVLVPPCGNRAFLSVLRAFTPAALLPVPVLLLLCFFFVLIGYPQRKGQAIRYSHISGQTARLTTKCCTSHPREATLGDSCNNKCESFVNDECNPLICQRAAENVQGGGSGYTHGRHQAFLLLLYTRGFEAQSSSSSSTPAGRRLMARPWISSTFKERSIRSARNIREK